ncbi:hypothetical protein L7F22_050788 [Adiantum nelumboides]|nr:hypothetical protein [Adiantum nelumboides]
MDRCTAQMATTERRTGLSRRGMTVLGKVPIAPKPLNLPSQRSTFCWGTSGRLQKESALLDPVSSDNKPQSEIVTPSGINNHGDGTDLQRKKTHSSSMTAKANLFSPEASITTPAMTIDNAGKMGEQRKPKSCSSFKSGKQETTDSSLQKGEDGCASGASFPPGFPHNGPPGNHSRSSFSSTDSQCNGSGNLVHSERSQNGSQSLPGIPYRNGTKDREIIVIHMVGAPGFYGNYPPQYGSPDCYNRNGGAFGNFPLQFGNFEPMVGLHGPGGPHLSASTGSDFFGEHEDFICYEKECFKGACHDVGRRRNSWLHGSYRDNSFIGSVQGEAYDPLISSATPTIKSRPLSHRHLSRNAGRSRSLYRTGRVVSVEETTVEPVAEKRITLLTKVSPHKVEAKNSLKEVGGDKDSQTLVSPVCSTFFNEDFCEDEGKAPEEICETEKVMDDAKVETSLPEGVSKNLEMIDDDTLPKNCKVEGCEALSSKATCNDKCLHCKGAAVMEGSASLVCQACEKTTVCESNFSTLHCPPKPTEEVPVTSKEKGSSVDGCKADVKHVILDADNYSTSTIKSEAVSKEQDTLMESKNCSLVSQSGNVEGLEMGTNLSSDISFKKISETKQKLVFRKKSQLKWTTKSGAQLRKAYVLTKMLGFQGSKLPLGIGSISSSDSKEILQARIVVAKGQQEDAVQEINTAPSSQLNYSKVSNMKMDTRVSFGGPVKRNTQRQLKLVYRKRAVEQAANRLQPSRNSSKTSCPVKSIIAAPQAELGGDHDKDEMKSTVSASAYKYHIIQRRVYHVVEGSERDHFLPSASFFSNSSSKQQLEMKERIVPTTSVSSCSSDSESILLPEPGSETKSCSSCRKDTFPNAAAILQESRSPLWSSRQEDNAINKNGKSGRPLSAWKPKVASQAADPKNSLVGKDREFTFPTSVYVELPEETSGSGLFGARKIPNKGNSIGKHSMGSSGVLNLASKSPSRGPIQFEEDNKPSSRPDGLLTQDKFVEKLSVNADSEGKAKRGSPKQAGDLPPEGLSAPMIHNYEDALALNEVKQISSQDNLIGNSKPFVKKKAMSFETANRYHQMLFRRYKEVGQWKPRANAQKKSVKIKENARANQQKAKASG